MQISFNSNVLHKCGNLSSLEVCDKDRDVIAQYFVDNLSVPP